MAGGSTAIGSPSPARRAVLSMAWLLLFSLIAKAAAFAREVILASRLGIGEITDQFAVSYALAQWLPTALGTVALSTIVPTLSVLRRASEGQREELISELIAVGSLVAIAVGMLTAVAPFIARSFLAVSPSLEISLPAMSVMAAAMVVVAFATPLLVAEHRQANLAFEALPALLVVLFLTVGPVPTLANLSWTTSVGYLLCALSLLHLVHRAGSWPRKLSLSLRSPGWRLLGKGSAALFVSSICTSAIVVADQAQAFNLGEGTAATLSFASRLLMLPSVILSMLVTRAMLPVFSELDPKKDRREFSQLVTRFTLVGLGIGTVTAALTWAIAPMLVSTFFERGSFTAADTAATASALRWGILQLPAFAASIVLVQALLSHRWFVAVAISGVFNFVGKIVANALLGPVMGADGIALATSIVLTLSLILLAAAYQRLQRLQPE